LNDRIFEYLEGVSLRQLVDNHRARENGVNTVHDMRPPAPKGTAVSA